MKASLGFVFLQYLLHAADAANTCRCLSTDPCWPSSSAFAELAAQVSQPLLAPVPPASACYPASSPSGDCATVQASWEDGNWRSNQSGAMQSPNFETFIFPNGTIDACYRNTSLGVPCDQGSIPVVGVDARSPGDVQAAVKFAAANNLRVAVKNTGHDYCGRSTARGAFLIWTHHLKDIVFHETFAPDGAPSSDTRFDVVTLGAGVQWQEAYDFVFARDRVIVGGASAGGSVGAAGGWVQGGGHSALAPKYGLGVDNVVQMTVVTSTGDYLTVNAHQDPDLFWALRGGGGGTYGVVLSVSYQTHPSTPLTAAIFVSSINATASSSNGSAASVPPVLSKLFTEFVRQTPAMADGGWSGYSIIGPSLVSGGAPSLSFLYIAMNVSWDVANATMLPFFEFANALAANSSTEAAPLTIDTAITVPYQSFGDWERQFFANETGQVGGNTELGSRLLPRDIIESQPEEVAETVLAVPNIQYYLVAGGAVAQADPSSTGLNPAWRKALIHTVFGTTWPEGASVPEIEAARQVIRDGEARLRALTPDSGAYFNEASLYEDDFKTTFFGSHYDKLRAIKKQYDPVDLFIVAEGVGSDEWDKDLNCRV